MDLSKIQKIYMIGIKGVGMTMIAQYLAAQGKSVRGSDVAETFMSDEVLKKAGIDVLTGFDAERISSEYDLIIYSTAWDQHNAEVEAARRQGLRLIKEIEARAAIFNPHYGIAVTGTHGKTTTSAWLAFVLQKANMHPSAMIGATVPQLGGASLLGSSNYFVVEADEYQNKLRYLDPKMILLNNVEYDHPDCYPTRADYEKAFADFIERLPKSGILIVNFDDNTVRQLAETKSGGRVVSYALNAPADYMATEIQAEAGRQFFKVMLGGSDSLEPEEGETRDLGTFSIALSGKHNISNALAVIVAAIELGVDLLSLRTYLAEFSGTARRAQKMGSFRGVDIIDDYAHHPTEIRAALEGMRQRYPDKKLRAVFHPHTFTRTKALLSEFGTAFGQADEVIVLDIYGSAREEQGGISGLEVAQKIRGNGVKDVKFIPSLEEAEAYLRETVTDGDVILLLGAGDVFRIGEALIV